MGMGHLWLEWVGHLGLKWVGQLWQSELLFLGDTLENTGLQGGKFFNFDAIRGKQKVNSVSLCLGPVAWDVATSQKTKYISYTNKCNSTHTFHWKEKKSVVINLINFLMGFVTKSVMIQSTAELYSSSHLSCCFGIWSMNIFP